MFYFGTKYSFVWQDQIGTANGGVDKGSSIAHEAGAEILNVVSGNVCMCSACLYVLYFRANEAY